MYRVAAYIRLSNEDGDRRESESVSSQRQIIETFVNAHESMLVVDEYVDDGYTGTNFNRPEFKRLISDVEGGRINCIVVKDLSRFGRNYVQVGYYLENFFPVNGIRFIAINDGFDTLNSTDLAVDFVMPIKNIFNAHYSQDIAKKVRSAFRAKQQNGEFVGAFASYGLMKDPNDKHKLIIDEAAAAVVRRIFLLYNQGLGKIAIARRLNDEKVPCPSVYKRMNNLQYCNSHRAEYTTYWTYSTIHKILTNEMYIGTMIQRRTERKVVRGKAIKTKDDEVIRVKNTHEAIIDAKTWEITQELLKHRGRQLDFQQSVGLFAGFVKCGDCGRALAKVRRNKEVYYICGTYKRYSSKLCRSHSVRESILENLILQKFNAELVKLEDADFIRNKSKREKIDLKKYDDKLNRLFVLRKEAYEDYKSGLLSKEEYISFKESYSKEEVLVKGQMDTLRQSMEEKSEREEWVENLRKYRRIEHLDRSILACILDGITVYEDENEIRVDIKLKYSL